MATTKPRITVTLPQEVYETIKGLSEAQGCSMSALISDFLEMVNPVQQRVLKAVRKAQILDAESKVGLVASLEQGEAQLTQMLAPMMDILDQLVEAQPPHSNTGVTTPNPPTTPTIKNPEKGRPRAAKAKIEAESWQRGFDDGKNAKKSSPVGDQFSYLSGYVEGKGAR